jgi:hypothetical protein
MAHGDPVADCNCTKFKSGSARASNGGLNYLGHLVEVDVARHDFTETVGNTDKRLVNVGIIETAGVKQAAMRRPLETFLDCIAFHYLVSPKLLSTSIQNIQIRILTFYRARTKKNRLFQAE